MVGIWADCAPDSTDPDDLVSGVEVRTKARLHLGFLDLNGGLGRRFGSLGVTIDRPQTRVTLRRADRTICTGHEPERAARYLGMLMERHGSRTPLALSVGSAIPAHSGLGSGTQLALAIGAAFARMERVPLTAREVAAQLGRGKRSGVGIGAFESGGLIVDGGGSGADGTVPPIVSRLPFPDDWRIVLMFDIEGVGVHGERELSAFAGLPDWTAEDSADICRRVLMSILPSAAEQDLQRFGCEVTALQKRIGDYFAPAQGGRFASPRVAEVLGWADARGIAGFGQSSWGPTGFALFADEPAALRFADEARHRWPEDTGLHFQVVRGCNNGASVRVHP